MELNTPITSDLGMEDMSLKFSELDAINVGDITQKSPTGNMRRSFKIAGFEKVLAEQNDHLFDKSPYKVDSPPQNVTKLEEMNPKDLDDIENCPEVKLKKGDSFYVNSFVTNGS